MTEISSQAAPAPEPYAAEQGTWSLRSPSGNTWYEQNPMACLRAEMNDRIPAKVQLSRIFAAVDEQDDEDAINAETVERFHHALAKHGWHPGRTDEPIADCVERALAAGPAGPYRNKRATPPISEQPAPDGAASLTEPAYYVTRFTLDGRHAVCEVATGRVVLRDLDAALAAKPEPVSAPARLERGKLTAQVFGAEPVSEQPSPAEAPLTLVVGGRYNWKNQPERLVYVGLCEPRNGLWHQFELVDKRGAVWCEVLPGDLHMIEATAAPAEAGSAPLADAWVPIHPKHGPIWSNTTGDPNPERLPSYPLKPLYFGAGSTPPAIEIIDSPETGWPSRMTPNPSAEQNQGTGRPLPAAWTTPEELRNAERGFGAFLWLTPKIHPEGEIPLYRAHPISEQGSARVLWDELRALQYLASLGSCNNSTDPRWACSEIANRLAALASSERAP